LHNLEVNIVKYHEIKVVHSYILLHIAVFLIKYFSVHIFIFLIHVPL